MLDLIVIVVDAFAPSSSVVVDSSSTSAALSSSRVLCWSDALCRTLPAFSTKDSSSEVRSFGSPGLLSAQASFLADEEGSGPGLSLSFPSSSWSISFLLPLAFGAVKVASPAAPTEETLKVASALAVRKVALEAFTKGSSFSTDLILLRRTSSSFLSTTVWSSAPAEEGGGRVGCG